MPVRVTMSFVTDKCMGKMVGEPYRGKPDVRFDEGAEGRRLPGNPPLATVNTHLSPSPHGCSTLRTRFRARNLIT